MYLGIGRQAGHQFKGECCKTMTAGRIGETVRQVYTREINSQHPVFVSRNAGVGIAAPDIIKGRYVQVGVYRYAEFDILGTVVAPVVK